jgi:hypothetical protein
VKRAISSFFTAELLCLLVSASVSAEVLYSNGSPNGTIDAWFISEDGQVADSFTLSSIATLTAVDNVGVWANNPDIPSTVEWSIWNGSGPGGGGTELFGPTEASWSNTFFAAGTGFNSNYDIYSANFSLPSIVLGPGTYWLQLENGSATNGGLIGWDQNDGPAGDGTGSQAWQSVTGYLKGPGCGGAGTPPPTGYCSESFEIIGNSAPEPNSLPVSGSLLVLILFFLRQKRSGSPLRRKIVARLQRG